MDKKIFSEHKNKIFFITLGVLVVLACGFLLYRFYNPENLGTIPVPHVVLPATNPYTFSTSSPLVITRTESHEAVTGTLFDYSGTLPAVGACESMSVQTTTYAKNPVFFAFIITTTATSSCANPNAPQTFTAGFGEDTSGNSPVLNAVFVNGNRVIYTLNGN